jgi:hypothetical protein
LASALQRNDEAPNEALAQRIVEAGDAAAVAELVANLQNADPAIQSDCIKVLYEVGGRRPDLIAVHALAFVNLLRSRQNRLVWGGMTALGAIAAQSADDLWTHVEVIRHATEKGSAITQDWGVRVLATISAHKATYEAQVLPFLKAFLENCPPKDLPRHAESVLIAANVGNREALAALLTARVPSLKAAGAKRVQAVIRKLAKA